jgi:very-short-patch-repair endonuclease
MGRMDPKVRTAEEVAARIASSQRGLATRAELLAAGVSATEIRDRLRNGALIREYRGVYRVGHRAPSVEASYLAAVLACGGGAVLSGLAAAHLYGLVKGRAPAPEVTASTEKRVPGLRTKRCRGLGRHDVSVQSGIPATTVPRTLVDIAPLLSPRALSLACHQAGVRYRTTPAQVAAVLKRRPSSKGAAKLRRILEGESPVVLSELEARFLELLQAGGLPAPTTNRPAGSFRVDARWPEHRVTVELDSYRFHNSRHAWEADRRREREAHARGDEFRRFTWGDVFERPRLILGELHELLAR